MIRIGIFIGLIFLLGNFAVAQKIGPITTEPKTNSKEINQKGKEVVLNLKNGYSVKGVIVNQTEQVVSIRTKSGEVFDYSIEQIESTSALGNDVISSKNEKRSSGIGSKENIVFNKGDKILNAGFGFGGKFYRDYFYQTNKIPTIIASYEIGVKDELFDRNSSLGIGAMSGFAAEWNNEYNYSSNYFFLGIKGAIHYQLIENLDTYGGLMLGLEFMGVNSIRSNELTQSFLLGGRYFLSEKVGGCLEFGVGLLTYGSIGIAIKL
jgi:hypothetical protein